MKNLSSTTSHIVVFTTEELKEVFHCLINGEDSYDSTSGVDFSKELKHWSTATQKINTLLHPVLPDETKDLSSNDR